MKIFTKKSLTLLHKSNEEVPQTHPASVSVKPSCFAVLLKKQLQPLNQQKKHLSEGTMLTEMC